MANGIDDYFKNSDGARGGIDCWADDEPLAPGNEDYLEPGRAGRSPSPLDGAPQASQRHLPPPGRRHKKPKPVIRRPHPDQRRSVVDAVRRQAERFPHWNAQAIAQDLTMRGIRVEAADVAQITGRALRAAAPGRSIAVKSPAARRSKPRSVPVRQPGKQISTSGRQSAETPRPSRSNSGAPVKDAKWLPMAIRLYAKRTPIPPLKVIVAELIDAGFPTVTRADVKRALLQAGLLRAPAPTSSSRKRPKRRGGLPVSDQVVRLAEKCPSCSGPVDVFSHCRCSN